MKIKQKVKSNEGNSAAVASWATTNVQAFRALASQDGGGKRVPEFWMPATGKATLSILDEDAVVSYLAYRVNEGGRRFNWYVAPPPGKPDLFADELGLRPSRRFVFRVIHHEGYTNRKNETIRDIPRFWVLGGRLYSQVKVAEEASQDTLLNLSLWVVRKGTGAQTAYSMVPIPRKAIPSKSLQEANKLLQWQRWYKPLDLAQQRTLLRTVATAEPMEEEDAA